MVESKQGENMKEQVIVGTPIKINGTQAIWSVDNGNILLPTEGCDFFSCLWSFLIFLPFDRCGFGTSLYRKNIETKLLQG
jgi:hypothetical protein